MKSKQKHIIVKILSLFVIISSTVFSQIDSTDYFPLQTGNCWELSATTILGNAQYNMKVVGDTLMNNGKSYKILALNMYHFGGWFYDFRYLRKDSNYVYRYYGDSLACADREYKYFDFEIPDSTIWETCRSDPGSGNARGLYRTYYSDMYYTFLQKQLETKLYLDVWVESTDTIWLPSDGSFHMRITKGIGMTYTINTFRWRIFFTWCYY